MSTLRCKIKILFVNQKPKGILILQRRVLIFCEYFTKTLIKNIFEQID